MMTPLLNPGPHKHRETNARLHQLLAERHPLIVVHRGSPGGSIVENTVKSVKAAIAQGADIVEIDVIRSTDGVFYVYHNSYEKMHFDLDEDIRTLSSTQIQELQYSWQVRSSAGRCGVEKLSDVLIQCPETILNIDRSWDYWDTLLDYLDEFNCADRVLLKSPTEASLMEKLDAHRVPYPYMPIVKAKEELELALGYRDLNTVAVEILAERPEDYLARVELIEELHKYGLLVQLNALNLPNGKPLFLGWDDEVSVLDHPDVGWGRLVEHGADIIQTDWPLLLRQYLEQR